DGREGEGARGAALLVDPGCELAARRYELGDAAIAGGRGFAEALRVTGLRLDAGEDLVDTAAERFADGGRERAAGLARRRAARGDGLADRLGRDLGASVASRKRRQVVERQRREHVRHELAGARELRREDALGRACLLRDHTLCERREVAA